MARPAWMKEPLAWLLLATAVLIVGQAVANVVYYPAAGELLVDDAYFFIRYARNFLATGVMSWNVGEPAIQGATSQLHQLFVVALLRATGDNSVRALQWASNVGFVAAAFGLVQLASRATRAQTASSGASTRATELAAAALALVTVGSSRQLMLHARSGMDTMLAVAVVAAALLVAMAIEQAPGGRLARASVVVVPLLVVVGHLTRADLVPLVAGPFVAIAAFSSRNTQRMRIALVIALAALGATLLVLQHLYGTALPLAFYVKHGAVGGADAGLRGRYHLAGLRFFGVYLTSVLPLLLVWGLAGLPMPKTRALQGALIAAVAFAVYHALFTLPIMGFGGRFFVPTLPAAVVLGAFGVQRFAHTRSDVELRRAIVALAVLVVAAHGMTVFDRVRRIVRGGRALPAAAYTDAGALDLVAETLPAWPALSTLSRDLPLRCSFAATEDGLPGAMNPTRQLLDMSGLHNPDISRGGESPAAVLTRQLPDLFYLPPGDYQLWNAQLSATPAFAGYEIFRTMEIGYLLDVAVRRDSPCYAVATAQLRALSPLPFHDTPPED